MDTIKICTFLDDFVIYIDKSMVFINYHKSEFYIKEYNS